MTLPGTGLSGAVASNGELAYVLEPRSWNTRLTKTILRALFADAILQTRAKAASAAQSLTPLVILAGPKIGDAMAAEIARYQSAYAPDVAWGLIDKHGRLELHGTGLDSAVRALRDIVAETAKRTGGSTRARQARALTTPFSDLGQWALKVLLAPEVPSHLLTAPRGASETTENSPVRNIRGLARRAKISEPRASDVVAALHRFGLIDRNGGQIHLVQRASLFYLWRSHHIVGAQDFGVRFALPSTNTAEQLNAALRTWNESGALAQTKGRRACLGLFAASTMLDLQAVRGGPLHVLVEDTSPEFLQELGLHRTEDGESPLLFVRKPPHPESAFRGLVMKDGVPTCDVLQLWLDVAMHPARGPEQADEIVSSLRILEEPV